MTADQEVTLLYDRKRIRMLRLKSSSMRMESLLIDTRFCCKDLEEQPSRSCALSSITHMSTSYNCQIEASHHPPSNPSGCVF